MLVTADGMLQTPDWRHRGHGYMHRTSEPMILPENRTSNDGGVERGGGHSENSRGGMRSSNQSK